MQTVVITGSARGFGLELARVFKKIILMSFCLTSTKPI